MIKKEKWGEWLLYAAWIFTSITFVYILWITWNVYSLSIGHYDGQLSLTLGILPFIFVSLLELTKIPLVKKIYKSITITSKSLLLIILLIITFITFETLVTGYEREYENYLNSDYAVNRLPLDIIKIWALAIGIIQSTLGIFLTFFGLALKNKKG